MARGRLIQHYRTASSDGCSQWDTLILRHRFTRSAKYPINNNHVFKPRNVIVFQYLHYQIYLSVQILSHSITDDTLKINHLVCWVRAHPLVSMSRAVQFTVWPASQSHPISLNSSRNSAILYKMGTKITVMVTINQSLPLFDTSLIGTFTVEMCQELLGEEEEDSAQSAKL